MAKPEKVRLTLEEFLRIPESTDGRRYELFEGELVVTASPFVPHQVALMGLIHSFKAWMDRGGRGLMLVAPVDVILSDDTVLVPDLLWISDERIPLIVGDRITGAPDIVVEILSPSTARRDRTRKAALYARLGVREYWIVDRRTLSIEILVPRRGRMVRHAYAASADSVASSVDRSLTVRPEQVFALPEK